MTKEVTTMNYKEILDNAALKKNFRIDDCINFEQYLSPTDIVNLAIIMQQLSPKQQKSFKQSIIRNAFFIELVKKDITSTKFQVRWTNQLRGDVRYTSYDECFKIFESFIYKFSQLSEPDMEIIKLFLKNNVIPYELPIDYINRYAEPIHIAANIDIYLNDDIKKCIKIRTAIKDKNLNPDSHIFTKILSDKIKVKTYLTDRALTGAHKTNREKRWETHPQSVQFSLRRNCNKIESKLLLQICMFKNTNPVLVNNLQRQHLLPQKFSFVTCPITGDIIDYNDFINDATNPTHGKSSFQVGHLNPLKSLDETGAFGHTSNNISWISEDGNRIQGSLSLDEVNALLLRIYNNHNFLDRQ